MARVPWNKGKHNVYSKAILKKMSRVQFIRFQNNQHPNLGRVMPEEQKVRFRKSLKEYYKTHNGYWKDKSLPKNTDAN
jgi:hypothetical protein